LRDLVIDPVSLYAAVFEECYSQQSRPFRSLYWDYPGSNSLLAANIVAETLSMSSLVDLDED